MSPVPSMAYRPTAGLSGALVNHASEPVVAFANLSPGTKPLIYPLNGGIFPPASLARFAVAVNVAGVTVAVVVARVLVST